MPSNKGGSGPRASVSPSGRWESLYRLHVTRVQAGDSKSTSRTVPGHLHPRPCPEQPAFGWPLPAPQSSGRLDSQGPGPPRAGATSSGCGRAPAPGGSAPAPVFQHLPETQPHYTAPCWFTAEIKLRNKLNSRFCSSRRGGQASGTPGRRPSVPAAGGQGPPQLWQH